MASPSRATTGPSNNTHTEETPPSNEGFANMLGRDVTVKHLLIGGTIVAAVAVAFFYSRARVSSQFAGKAGGTIKQVVINSGPSGIAKVVTQVAKEAAEDIIQEQ